MRVTFVIATLQAGGAERTVSRMANYWAEKGWQITFLTLDDGSAPPFFRLHPTIVHRALGIAGASPNGLAAALKNAHRAFRLREAITASKPQVVISAIDTTNVLVLLAVAGLNLPTIVQEHSDPFSCPIGRPWELLRRLLYPRATSIILLTERAIPYFPPRVRQRCRVIPNAAMLPDDGEPNDEARVDGDRQGKTMMAMGRLGPEKGFDLLLHAFAEVAPRHPCWSLEIVGEGSLRSDLETLCSRLGLDDCVRLPGRTRHVLTQMKRADLFVLSSRFEGFPTVLIEAMGCGLPVISFDCRTGPREIIRDGMDGVLVPAGDVKALAAAMDRLMADEAERRRLGARAPDVLVRFGAERVMGMWEGLIREILSGPSGK